MSDGVPTVFLLDIDNTLIDHDELKHRVTRWIEGHVGRGGPGTFWRIYEEAREELGIVDFLECATRFGTCIENPALGSALKAHLWEFPFEELLLPGTLAGCSHLSSLGRLAVLCDGEPAFQRRKLERIELLEHLDEVFVFDHKEEYSAEVLARFPGSRFVMFDDKPRVLGALKEALGASLTTVHVRHGHYAATAAAADFSIASLAEALGLNFR